MEDNAIWQQFLKFTPEGVLDIDFETQRFSCSASLAGHLCLTPDTLPRTLEQWFELYHPDDYDVSREFRRHLFEDTGENFSLERRLYCGDGQYRWFRIDVFCVRGDGGRILRMIGVETPIRQKADEDLRPADLMRELRESLTSAEEGEKDLSARLARAEARCASLERQLHLATQMLDATPDLLFHCDAEGRADLFNDAFARALAGNPDLARWVAAVRDDDEHRREYRCRDSAGRDRTLDARAWSPTNRYGGKIEGHIGVASDVTEIREMESEALRLRHLMGSLILKNGLSGVLGPEMPGPGAKDERALARRLPGGEGVGEGRDSTADAGEILKKYLNDALRSLSCTIATAEPASPDALLPARVAQFEDLVRASERAELEVGVVGITSSGKSTFINAMMGERLLPEETRATTNLAIRCRRGDERAVIVVTKDGGERRVSGIELTPAWMEGLASERLNPANERNVERLEWISPGALLPEGLVLIDTPGLDACDFPEHSELVLRRLLPSLDIVLYVTSIRNRFKAGDLELLQAVLEQDQRVVFLLSQIDLERDDTEGGRVMLSRREKLFACVRELREDIETIASERTSLRDCAVVPVSSKLAMAHFYDRESPAWGASNFGPLIRQMENFRDNLSQYGLETRARRALALFSRTAADLGLVLGNISTEQAEAEGAARLERIRELRDAQRWTSAEVSAVRNEWRRLLDPGHHLRRLERKIAELDALRAIRDCYEQWGEECAMLAARMTVRMDRARLSCRDVLHKLGIVLQGRSGEVPDIEGSLPSFYGYVRHEARQVQVRGWFEDLQFWPQYKIFFRQDVDREKMLAGVEGLLTERLHLLNEHLTWWENRMREDWCDPLYEELEREEAALADIRRIATDASVSRSALRGALSSLREAERGVRALMSGLSLPDIDSDSLFSEDLFDRFEELPDVSESPVETKPEDAPFEVFAPLLAAFREQDIQSRFLNTNALRGRGRIVLLGLRRHDSLRFLARLAHDVSLTDSLRTEEGAEVDERDWIFCGSTPPALPHARIAVPDTLLREAEVLVAPGDGLCASLDAPPVDWDALFAEWVPVVHLDAARIDSGLSDIARAPYAEALSRVDRWVAASGQGALFSGRLTDLLTDVPDRLNDFMRSRGYRGRADWFIYENYAARYTDFVLWGGEMLRRPDACGGSLDSALLVEKWIRAGHDFTPPFSEHRLRRAMDGAVHRRRGEWKRDALGAGFQRSDSN
ncbi:MAG: dynamin family protein [Synergistaceae bacterium]|jgi:PAS domain-containing protein/ribosome biogenesis GTPase A|nr:dynamin family protein [Synergistaceae bacterium]